MRLPIAILSGLLVTVAGQAQTVTAIADPTADFVGYDTYTWAVGSAARAEWVEELIHEAIDGELQVRGLVSADEDGDVEVATFASGWSGWLSEGQQLALGTLQFVMVDPTNQRIVWRAYASELMKTDTAAVQKTVEKSVRKMFKKYPVKRSRSQR